MILLIGGTSETAPIAAALLELGEALTVSLATATELSLPEHPRLAVRRGRLDRDGFQKLFISCGINLVVDASHPYAEELHREVAAACAAAGVTRIRYRRPGTPLPEGTLLAPDHAAAARLAVSLGRPILLTTGSRHLAPYVAVAREAGIALYARLLPGEESRAACLACELSGKRVEFARGPFSVQVTRDLLCRWEIGTLVAKDGGAASGLSERLEAAQLEGAQVVVVTRPPDPGDAAESLEELQIQVRTALRGAA